MVHFAFSWYTQELSSHISHSQSYSTEWAEVRPGGRIRGWVEVRGEDGVDGIILRKTREQGVRWMLENKGKMEGMDGGEASAF